MPLIPDALAHLVCDVVGTYPVGDHTPYVGRVGYLGYASGSPLVFYTGEYGRMDVRLWDHSYIWKPDPWQ
jgi:flavin reductase (DIM6/NTAB) family NADH-FMN oxidoreductase RutF